MRDFEYEAPMSLDDAVALLSGNPAAAKPLAGGTDLIDHIRTRRLEPDLVVDVKKIPDLNVLEFGDDGLRLGAAVPCYRIYGDPQIAAAYSALADSCRIIGGTQIQSRASVGGNLCNSGPAADSTPSLIALGARVVIAGSGGRREVAAEDFCTGPGQNVLESGELVVELVFPARPAVGGEAAGAARSGQPVSDEAIAAAADAAREAATPIDDMRGTVEFRKHISGVLTDRVIREAVARARGEETGYRIGQ